MVIMVEESGMKEVGSMTTSLLVELMARYFIMARIQFRSSSKVNYCVGQVSHYLPDQLLYNSTFLDKRY